MAREFDCCECGRHIVQIIPDESPLCAQCLHLPGWFRDPELRRILDPDHDGREVAPLAEGEG